MRSRGRVGHVARATKQSPSPVSLAKPVQWRQTQARLLPGDRGVPYFLARFGRKGDVAPHERNRTGEKPHACSMCPMTMQYGCRDHSIRWCRDAAMDEDLDEDTIGLSGCCGLEPGPDPGVDFVGHEDSWGLEEGGREMVLSTAYCVCVHHRRSFLSSDFGHRVGCMGGFLHDTAGHQHCQYFRQMIIWIWIGVDACGTRVSTVLRYSIASRGYYFLILFLRFLG